ncbi:hypothetical protein B0H14DRAFT_2564016 [Mycena olivaceomarginata]|nr:hypothetical protein B0H14DRAFT_2564016 [Mycena olivaceomarginata]
MLMVTVLYDVFSPNYLEPSMGCALCIQINPVPTFLASALTILRDERYSKEAETINSSLILSQLELHSVLTTDLDRRSTTTFAGILPQFLQSCKGCWCSRMPVLQFTTPTMLSPPSAPPPKIFMNAMVAEVSTSKGKVLMSKGAEEEKHKEEEEDEALAKTVREMNRVQLHEIHLPSAKSRPVMSVTIFGRTSLCNLVGDFHVGNTVAAGVGEKWLAFRAQKLELGVLGRLLRYQTLGIHKFAT